MPSSRYGNVTVFHNGDRQGPVVLLVPAAQVVMVTDGMVQVTVDATLLRDFTADTVRANKIAALEVATPAQILANWLSP